jgi:hypothetical protein
MCIMHMMPGPSSDGEFNTFVCFDGVNWRPTVMGRLVIW